MAANGSKTVGKIMAKINKAKVKARTIEAKMEKARAGAKQKGSALRSETTANVRSQNARTPTPQSKASSCRHNRRSKHSRQEFLKAVVKATATRTL